MSDEPKIRLVVSKHQLAGDLQTLSRVLDEYAVFLSSLDPGSDWASDARRLLKGHWERLDRAKVALQTLDLVGAVIRQVLALQPGKRIVLSINDSADNSEGAGAPSSGQVATSPESFRALAANVAGLLQNAPLSMQEKLRFLLGSLLRLVNEVPDGNVERLEELLSEINLLTSSRESQSLVREIALLAREVYDSIQAMSEGLPIDALAESTEGASEAVRKLNGVMQRLEQAATQNLDQVEGMMKKLETDQDTADALIRSLKAAQQRLAELKVSHPQHQQALDTIQNHLSDGVGSVAMQLRIRMGGTSERYMALLSSQGFQDHTGSTLRRIVQFVENLQGQIVTLLEKYQTVLALHQGPPDLSEAPATEKVEAGQTQSQNDVDSLLAKLGV